MRREGEDDVTLNPRQRKGIVNLRLRHLLGLLFYFSHQLLGIEREQDLTDNRL